MHFLAVFAYAFPFKEDNKFKTLSFVYIYPYFHQSWTLFVPIPKQNFYVYVKSKNNHWRDLFYELNTVHQNNRLCGQENLILSLTNSLRYYASSIKTENCIAQDDNSNIYFDVLKKVIVNYLFLSAGKKPEELEIIIRIKDINDSSDYSHYYKINN